MEMRHDVKRTRLDNQQRPIEEGDRQLQGEAARVARERGPNCGSCYGAETPQSGCCNTCDDVRDAYERSHWSFENPDDIEQCVAEHWSERIREQNHEGCNVAGDLHVNKVVGSLFLSPGRAFQHGGLSSHSLVPYLQGSGDEYHHFGHIIHEFSFGMDGEFPEPLEDDYGHPYISRKHRLGIEDPLRGHRAHTSESQFMFQYFLKVVPTEVHELDGEVIKTYQYSATSHERDLVPFDPTKEHNPPGSTRSGAPTFSALEGVPGVFITYDISPLRVVIEEKSNSFSHFLTQTCAIVGGILTIAGLIDAAIYRSRRQFGMTDYAYGDDSLDELDGGSKML